MQLTIRDAAQQIGMSKATLFRAIRAGKLSASRAEDGSFRVDPAELHRVFPVERLATRDTEHHGAGLATGSAAGTAVDAVEIQIRAAALEAELRAVRELADELRADRDLWRSQSDTWRRYVAQSGRAALERAAACYTAAGIGGTSTAAVMVEVAAAVELREQPQLGRLRPRTV